MSLQLINSPTTWKRAQTSINANFTALLNAVTGGPGAIDATDPAVTALLTDSGSGAYTAVEGILEDRAEDLVLQYAPPRDANVLHMSEYASLSAAVTAAGSLSGPVIIKFGPEGGSLSSALTITRDDLYIDLNGSTLASTASGTAIKFDGAERCGIYNGTLDLGNTGTIGVNFADCDTAYAANLTVVNPTSGVTTGVAATNSENINLRDVNTDGFALGIALDTSPNGSIIGGTHRNNVRDGVLVYRNSTNAIVSGVHVYGFDSGGVGGRAGIQVYGSDYVTVTGNLVRGDGGGGSSSPCIKFRDASHFTCTGNLVDGDGVAGGIMAQTNSDMGTLTGIGTIADNTIYNAGFAGISVALAVSGSGADVRPFVIGNNFIYGVRANGAGTGFGISIGSAIPNVVINGGYIFDCDSSGISSQAAYGIINNVMVRQVGKVASGARAGIFVVGGVHVVSGCLILDDAGSPTMQSGLRTNTGATAVVGSNYISGAVAAPVINGGEILQQVGPISTSKVGFYGTTPVSKPTVSGSKGGNAALTSLLSALASLGLVTDSTT